MKTGQILLVAVLIVSLAANVWMGMERLQVKYYQKGISDGIGQVGDRIVQEVRNKGRLAVKMPSGVNVVLTVQKSNMPIRPSADKNPVIKGNNVD